MLSDKDELLPCCWLLPVRAVGENPTALHEHTCGQPTFIPWYDRLVVKTQALGLRTWIRTLSHTIFLISCNFVHSQIFCCTYFILQVCWDQVFSHWDAKLFPKRVRCNLWCRLEVTVENLSFDYIYIQRCTYFSCTIVLCV